MPRLSGALVLLALLFVTTVHSGERPETDVFVARAIVAYEAGRYEEALRELEEALAIDPRDVEALFYKGRAEAALGRLEDSARSLEAARAQAPDDEAIAHHLGMAWFRLGKDERARPLLEAVFAKSPDRDGLGYAVGVLRYRAGEYEAAIEALRANVTSDPEVTELAQLYEALALVREGLTPDAVAALEEALRLRPASPLTGPAERLRELAGAARPAPGRRLAAQLRVGGVYDDNVPVNPARSDDPTVRELRGRESGSPGALTALRLDHAFLQRDAYDGVASYSFFSTTYSDLPEFDLMDHLVSIRGARRGAVRGIPYQLDLEGRAEILLLGLDRFVERYTLAPTLTAFASRRHSTSLQLQLRADRFAEDEDLPEDDRLDGENVLAGFLHVFRWSEQSFGKLGYQWDLDGADGRNLRYVGHRVVAGAGALLPVAEVRAGYDFDVHLRDYRYRNTSFPVDDPGSRERFDTELTHIVWLARPITRNLSLAATAQLIDARSNLDVFEFRRNVVTLEILWTL